MAPRVQWFFLLLTVCGLVPHSAAKDYVPNVESMLSGLESVRTLNYRGAFTYEYGGTLDTLEITHGVIDGMEYEKIVHLAGPERKFLRNGRPLNCVNAGTKLLRKKLFASEHAAHAGENLSDSVKASLKQNYEFFLRGKERIAGRNAHTLQVVPTDEFRYGFTFGIDVETGLLTKTLVSSPEKKIIERIQFVSLDLNVPFNKNDFSDDEKFYSIPPLEGCQSDEIKPSPWRPAWVPLGFILAGTSYTEQDGYMESYTDGLASFSIFVRNFKRGDEKQSMTGGQPGMARRGATLALMSILQIGKESLDVTVVGEIPPVSARKIISSIQRN